MFRSLPLVLLCAIGFGACGAVASGDERTRDALYHSQRGESVRSNLTVEGTRILIRMLDAYLLMKDGLVAEDELAVHRGNAMLDTAADALHNFILSSSSGYYHLWTSRDTVMATTKAMLRLKDETFARRRLYFKTLSSNLYGLFQKAGLRGAIIYRFYDPAAFNDAGAYWLSNSSHIRNPYFGRKMPEWGELVDSLR